MSQRSLSSWWVAGCTSAYARFPDEERLMSIQVKCPNASCGKVIEVKKELARRPSLCPACGTGLSIPESASGVDPMTSGSAGAGFWGTIESRSLALQMDAAARALFGVAILSLFLQMVSTFFRWVSISIGTFSVGVLGIDGAEGKLVFILALGVGIFAAVAFFKKPAVFTYSLYTGAGWGGLSLLWLGSLVLRAGSHAGLGLYLGVLASIGVASTFGFLAFRAAKQS
jgi:hypothetical protein